MDDHSPSPLLSLSGFCSEAAAISGGNPKEEYMLCRINIMNFRLYNRMFGPEGGDRLLREYGVALWEEFSPLHSHVRLGRCGVDHFLLFAPKALLENMGGVYTRTRNQLLKLLPDSEGDVQLGCCHIPRGEQNIFRCCEGTLEALETLRKGAPAHWALDSESLQTRVTREAKIISDMRRALKQGQFMPFFQPQYDYETGCLYGAEALTRWQHPELGPISPEEFIPLFEQNGFIYDVDIAVWQQSCGVLKAWRQEGIGPDHISVNISRADFNYTDALDRLEAILEENGLQKKDVHLEITESAFLQNPERFESGLRSLHDKGFIIEMDDFGGGYSSLNLLKEANFDVLKLDTALQQDHDKTGKAGVVLSSVVDLAHRLDMPVIAEGVEKPSQAEFLKSIGCRYMQGYLFGRPLPREEFTCLLRKGEILKPSLQDQADYVARFLDMRTQEALLFNSFVGGACIIRTLEDKAQVIRANDNFFSELDMERDFAWKDGFNLLEWIRAVDVPMVQARLDLAREKGTEQAMDTCVVHPRQKDGLWVHIRFRYLNSQGGSAYYYLSLENITPRREMENRIRELTHKLTTLLDNLPGSIVRLSSEGEKIRCLYMTEKHARDRGYTKSELLQLYDSRPESLIHPDDAPELMGALRQVFEDHNGFRRKYRIICKDGKLRHMLMTTSYDKENSHVIAFCNDITSEEEIAVRLARNEKELLSLTGTESVATLLAELEGDGRQRILSLSPGILMLSGYSEEESRQLYSEDPDFAVYAPDRLRVQNNLKQADSAGRLPGITYRSLCKGGSKVWLNRKGVVIQSEGHTYYSFVYTNLSSSYRLFESILNETDIAVIVTDMDRHEILYANRVANELFRDGQDLVGEYCYRVFENPKFCSDCREKDTLCCREELLYGGKTYSVYRSRIDWNGLNGMVSYISEK